MSSRMSTEDLKIYALNSIAVLVSFSEIEAILKIILLLGSIVYTAQRIYVNYKDFKNK
jgi:hypothetical protein